MCYGFLFGVCSVYRVQDRVHTSRGTEFRLQVPNFGFSAEFRLQRPNFVLGAEFRLRGRS